MNDKKLNTTVCQTMEEQLVLYHYGELDGDALARVEGHLATCGHCRAELDAMRAMLSGMQPEAPPQFAVARSVNRVKAQIRHGRRAPGWLARLSPVAITAAIVLLAVGIYHNVEFGPVNEFFPAKMETAETAGTDGLAEDMQAGAGTEAEAVDIMGLDEDEALLLTMLDGPPATSAEAPAPQIEVMGPHPLGAVTEADPPIYALVEFEPIEDVEVIGDLELIEGYDAIADLQDL